MASGSLFSQKMIFAKTCLKTHNREFLAIVETFSTCRHYLKDCKYKVLFLINHNNYCPLIDTKCMTFRQVWWIQMLSQYYFQIYYWQNKANKAANAILQFLQRNKIKDNVLRDNNTQILYHLQALLINGCLSNLRTKTDHSTLHKVKI